MEWRIIGAESLGVRGLCCLVTAGPRRILIDPGVALGYVRHRLLPHPRQVAAGRLVRRAIVAALNEATDVVFSHFHGDHVPLADANPYQLSLASLAPPHDDLRAWCLGAGDLPSNMRRRYDDLAGWLGTRLREAEGTTDGPLTFSRAEPHGQERHDAPMVMMTRVASGGRVFVHASDIQLLHAPTIDRILDWRPDVVLAAGPPLYLDRLSVHERQAAWDNACRLAASVDRLILDHHLLREETGLRWLEELSHAVGRRVFCAADDQGRTPSLLEARREQLYARRPVPDGWHDRYAQRWTRRHGAGA